MLAIEKNCNLIQNKSFVYIIDVCLLCIFNIFTCIYLYNLCKIYLIYKHNIFFLNIYMHVCVFIYT